MSNIDTLSAPFGAWIVRLVFAGFGYTFQSAATTLTMLALPTLSPAAIGVLGLVSTAYSYTVKV